MPSALAPWANQWPTQAILGRTGGLSCRRSQTDTPTRSAEGAVQPAALGARQLRLLGEQGPASLAQRDS